MPRLSGQKRKILYLAKFLLEETDEDHPATVQDMIKSLSHQGIEAERKSIYGDLEELRVFGLDIICTRGKTTGYFIGERTFQLPEVRLLVDAVQSSRFLTRKKSEALIGKLETLLSRSQAKNVSREVLVAGRIKTMNESVYANVDAIGSAIGADKKIEFRYFEWGPDGEKRFRRDGAYYTVSPSFLIWDDEKYYLVALEENGERRHFRVDKMLSIRTLEEKREKAAVLSASEKADYEKKTFGMYGGKEERVRLWCRDSLAGVFYDRFGSSLVTRKSGDGFEVSIPVAVSPTFFSWVMGFGDRVRIVEPSWVREEFLEQTRNILRAYGEAEG